jgi:hypothetical protein
MIFLSTDPHTTDFTSYFYELQKMKAQKLNTHLRRPRIQQNEHIPGVV